MLSPRWHKVLKDLWGNKARTLLAVMAIAAGVFAVGTISTTYFVLGSDVNVTYAAIHPAHGVLTTGPLDEALVKVARCLPGVEEAEGRFILGSMNILLADNKKHPLTMTAVEAPSDLHLDQLKLLSGDWPGKLEMLVIPSQFAREGDLVQIELPDGRIRRLRVSGVVQDLNGTMLGADLELPVYVDLATLDVLGLPRTFNRLYYRVAGDAPTSDDVETAEKDIERLFARNGVAIVRSSIHIPNQHPLAYGIEGLLGVLALMSILLLALGGLLVTNTVSSLLAQHVRQIGIMKAIGALYGQVLGMYLALASGFGAMAAVISMPVAPRAGYALAQWLAGLMNADILEFRIFPSSFLLMLTIGLLTPCLASLVPVLNALHISVHEALTSYGTTSQFGNSIIDRLVEHIRGLSRPLLMSLRNTFRRKGRLVLTLSALSLAGAIFMSVFVVRASVMHMYDRLWPLLISDLIVDFKYTYRTEKITRIIEQTPGVTHAEGWVAANGELLDTDGHTVADRLIIDAPPLDSLFTRYPPLVEGRWLREGDRNALVIATEVARRYPALKIGDTLPLRVNGHTVTFIIVGKYEDVLGEEAKRAFGSYAYISQLVGEPGRARSYRVSMTSSDLAVQEHVSDVILDAVSQPGDTPAFITGASGRKSVFAGANALAALLMMVALLIVGVGCISLASAMSMNVLERTREIGVMRAVGAKNADIRQVVIVEGVLVGFLSWPIGLGLSFPLSYFLSNMLGMIMLGHPIDCIYDWTGVVIWLGLVVVIAALASLWPAINAGRMTVRDALAYE